MPFCLWSSHLFLLLLFTLAPGAIICLMQPGAGGGGGGGDGGASYRVPPRWGPGRHHESFRDWVVKLMLWIQLTDLQPAQQVAAILLRLEGTAAEMAKALTPQEIAKLHRGQPVSTAQLGDFFDSCHSCSS